MVEDKVNLFKSLGSIPHNTQLLSLFLNKQEERSR